MGVGVAQHKTGGFGEHYSLSVAHTLLVEADALRREWHMRVFGDVLGVDDHSVVLHTAQVEHFAAGNVERAEFGYNIVEIDTPFCDALVAR